MTGNTKLSDWIRTEDNDGVHVNFGKTNYVARITDLHEKYNFDREFISEKGDTSHSGKTGKLYVPASELEEGYVYEVRDDSWNNEKRQYWILNRVHRDDDGQVTGVDTEEIEYEEIEDYLREEMVGRIGLARM
ncbi:hypothetical protein [Halorubrum vacuolatum]|uniref:Uncharacterized protein n=1 Tax=Halorubrum vacuolatum TaxID=63740 RepID=A0A238WTD5_HALVU|nr:hypothetical protein [Halorubrum vacuolatum]SNR49822.1 hypothetical protein SAMN06264855_11024 [Halorubrum vacuolatum]